MDQVKRYNSLWLVNNHSDRYLLLHNFVVQMIPFKLEKLKKNSEEKKDMAKSVHKACYIIMQITILKTTTLTNYIIIKLLHTPETFYLSNFFNVSLYTLSSSFLKMYCDLIK